jgi:hypothetical protein
VVTGHEALRKDDQSRAAGSCIRDERAGFVDGCVAVEEHRRRLNGRNSHHAGDSTAEY